MSKAVLVMDMPESCDVCDMIEMVNGKLYCGVKGCGQCSEDYVICRPDWCPLKPLPEKQIVHCTDTTHHRFAKDGFNACLDEILKERE